MKNPKVAYLLLWFPEPSQTFILHEVNTLVDLGLDVEVFTLYGPRSPRRLQGLAPVRAPVHHLGLRGLGQLARALMQIPRPGATLPFLARVLGRGWRNLETALEAAWAAAAGVYLARRLRAAGVGHIHAPWATGPATAAWVASRLSAIPFSFAARAHDLHPPDGSLPDKMAAAAFIRTNTRANQLFLQHYAPEWADKVINIYNGVALPPAPPRRDPPGPPWHLLALGRLVAKKGFPVLLEAVRRLIDQGMPLTLTLAGDGPDRAALLAQVRHLNLGDRVELPGHVPHTAVPDLLARAHLFVMPSIIAPSGDRDGIPNVILEALHHQVPVVATAVAGIPEVVRPGVTGWLTPPGDPAALAAAIQQALADPGAARHRAQAGQDLIAAEFSASRNYARLKDRFLASAH